VATLPNALKIENWSKSPSVVENIMASIVGMIVEGGLSGGAELPSDAEYAASLDACEEDAWRAKQRLYSAYPGLVVMRGNKFYVK
jgi:DNA-binding transcriptional regulator YhcF (GntR family)